MNIKTARPEQVHFALLFIVRNYRFLRVVQDLTTTVMPINKH
jgi:hypothetical protein